jgi:hypothetical protein
MILLIDRNSLKQQLRATVFRNCEIDVHTTDSVSDALRLCRLQPYDMVLLAADQHSGEASRICGELLKASPRQRIALLVGPPKYLLEIGFRKGQVPSDHVSSGRRLHLVEPQPQPTQWRVLMDRLLVAG